MEASAKGGGAFLPLARRGGPRGAAPPGTLKRKVEGRQGLASGISSVSLAFALPASSPLFSSQSGPAVPETSPPWGLSGLVFHANLPEKGLPHGLQAAGRRKRGEWCQPDLGSCQQLRFSHQHILHHDGRAVVSVTPVSLPAEIRDQLLVQVSPTGRHKAILSHHLERGQKQEVLEVWSNSGRVKRVNLTEQDKHGRVYTDEQFGCLAWSSSETQILYVAERKRPKMQPLLSQDRFSQEGEKPSETTKGEQYVYYDNWGEMLNENSVPVLCVLDVQTNEISVPGGVPGHVSPGQALWSPNNKGIIFVGWWHEPFRLGLKACSNRRSALFLLELSGNSCELLSSDCQAVSSPRLSLDGTHLLYLEGPVFGPHRQCLKLQMLNWQTKLTCTVVDVVRTATRTVGGGYQTGECEVCYSRYNHISGCRLKEPYSMEQPLPKYLRTSTFFSLWAPLELWHRLVGTATKWLPEKVVSTPKWQGLQSPITVTAPQRGAGFCWEFNRISWWSAVHRPIALRCCVSAWQKVGVLPPSGREQELQWVRVVETSGLPDLEWKILTVQPSATEESIPCAFEALLLRPQGCQHGGKGFPLIVSPHGGPHAVFEACWRPTMACLCRLGFAVLMVNYRGSLGFGQASIDSLISRVGIQDVEDTQLALELALQSEPLDPNRIALLGGSHGGFICCHLLGRYPKMYKACAVRSPVINMATLLGTSDIPDWRYASLGLPYFFERTPSEEDLVAMLLRSPIIHAAKVNTPVLLCVGAKDQRVSPYQSVEYYRVLQARGIPVRLLWYPEGNHAISGVQTEADFFMNCAQWIMQHLSVETGSGRQEAPEEAETSILF
ncbi:acylamino-acid-releasing enzyme-like isoform X2 [Paroedura picta]|uniref:acylamino-acid-releasing enzyme-like isoform X2 n=1 Tax=Paroedura picta TaxID=143630 RepID=UPI0040569687